MAPQSGRKSKGIFSPDAKNPWELSFLGSESMNSVFFCIRNHLLLIIKDLAA